MRAELSARLRPPERLPATPTGGRSEPPVIRRDTGGRSAGAWSGKHDPRTSQAYMVARDCGALQRALAVNRPSRRSAALRRRPRRSSTGTPSRARHARASRGPTIRSDSSTQPRWASRKSFPSSRPEPPAMVMLSSDAVGAHDGLAVDARRRDDGCHGRARRRPREQRESRAHFGARPRRRARAGRAGGTPRSGPRPRSRPSATSSPARSDTAGVNWPWFFACQPRSVGRSQ